MDRFSMLVMLLLVIVAMEFVEVKCDIAVL